MLPQDPIVAIVIMFAPPSIPSKAVALSPSQYLVIF